MVAQQPYATELRKYQEVTERSIAILLCTMNGESYLQAQLDSFKAQTHSNWTLWASDDGSTDQTLNILARFKSNFAAGKVTIVSGPKKGFAANFLSLLTRVEPAADFYAYSDQDDIWQPSKLQLAAQWLRSIASDKPALYCTRTELIDANGMHIGFSRSWVRKPSFQNALTQNLAGGNTMVFNHAAQKLLFMAGSHVDIFAHDWWTYLVVTAVDGEVFFDTTPTLQYRQHDNNIVGANHGLTAPLGSVKRLITGRFKLWNAQNIAALKQLDEYMPHTNKAVLQMFDNARSEPLFARLSGVYRSGVYRQTLVGNLGLAVATLLKRI